MNDLKSTAPELWRQFDDICGVPHPSGHEQALRGMLARCARDAGLRVRIDPAGNLRIDRPAAAGLEKEPLVLMQCHLDMVPQSTAGFQFDFLHERIVTEIRGGWLGSAAMKTTLGADNGVGIAAAMSLLLDHGLAAGPTAMLATVEEEIGMNGARHASPDFLDCDVLLNLDSETEGVFCVGCAGGVRLEIEFGTESEPCPDGMQGVRISVAGMKGGHSGMDIGLRRGNALRTLLEFLSESPSWCIGGFSGGSQDNAIPRDATATAAATAQELAAVTDRVAEFTRRIRQRFDVPPGFILQATPADTPGRVWTRDTARRIITSLLQLPDGVLEYDDELRTTVTSNNLATVGTLPDKVIARCLFRSLSDTERDRAARAAATECVKNGASVRTLDSYPGWTPQKKSAWSDRLAELYRSSCGLTPRRMAIHAGLECGVFASLRPELRMLSFGPDIRNPHSPSECVRIASAERFHRFLRIALQQAHTLSLA